MHTLIFPLKIWAKECALYTAEYDTLFHWTTVKFYEECQSIFYSGHLDHF